MEENQNRAPQFSPEEPKAEIPVFQSQTFSRETPHTSFFNGKTIIVIVLVLLVGIFVGWTLMRQSLEQFDSEYDFDEQNFGDGFDFDEDTNEYSGASQDNSNTPEDSDIPAREEIPESGDVETNLEGFSLFDQDESMFSFVYPAGELTQPLMEQIVGNTTTSRFHLISRYLSEEGHTFFGLTVNAYADMFAFDPTQEGPEILVNSQTRYINTKNSYGGQVFSDSWGNEYFVASGKNPPCGLGDVCSGSWIGVKRLTTPVNGISYILVIGLKEVFTLEEFKQTIESIN